MPLYLHKGWLSDYSGTSYTPGVYMRLVSGNHQKVSCVLFATFGCLRNIYKQIMYFKTRTFTTNMNYFVHHWGSSPCFWYLKGILYLRAFCIWTRRTLRHNHKTKFYHNGTFWYQWHAATLITRWNIHTDFPILLYAKQTILHIHTLFCVCKDLSVIFVWLDISLSICIQGWTNVIIDI